MPASRKIFSVQNLAEKFKQAKALVLTDYSGLKVGQINELRKEIKKAGGEFEIVKNRLLGLAMKESKFSGLDPELKLIGPTAAMWVYQDDFSLLKILVNFVKKTELPKISGACSFRISGACSSRIKFGFWDGKMISIERIKELASLPGMPELRNKLVGTLQSPIYGLTRDLKWNIQKLVLVLKVIKPKGGES